MKYPQGIVFSMIITRIGLSVAWKGREKDSSLAALKPSRQSAAVFKQTMPMVPDVIHVTTTVEERFDETSDYDKGSPQWSAHSGKFTRPLSLRYFRCSHNSIADHDDPGVV